VPEKKRSLSREELEDRGWRREERRYAWTQGGRGTQFQAYIAELAYPPADAAFMKHLVALAWTPHYAAILQRILDEARRDPGQGGFDRAIEAAREAFNNIMGEPRNVGGRPKHDASSDLRVFVAYGRALAEAKRADPNVKIGDVQAAFVRQHRMSKVRELTEAIRRARRSGPWVDFLVEQKT
jgi:hypothetical protein